MGSGRQPFDEQAFGDALDAALATKGANVRQLAEQSRSGGGEAFTASYLSHVRRGVAPATPALLARVTRTLDVGDGYFLEARAAAVTDALDWKAVDTATLAKRLYALQAALESHPEAREVFADLLEILKQRQPSQLALLATAKLADELARKGADAETDPG